jgi:hypothetical protein
MLAPLYVIRVIFSRQNIFSQHQDNVVGRLPKFSIWIITFYRLLHATTVIYFLDHTRRENMFPKFT